MSKQNGASMAKASESISLELEVTDRNVITFLSAFEDRQARIEKAIEALKVGVIAIQSASPTLDTEVVQAKFGELEGRLQDYVDEFKVELVEYLGGYFKEGDGVIPKSLNSVFGEDGRVNQLFQTFFHPSEGRLSHLMQTQIGPASVFGRIVDPKNKEGILAQIETRVQELVESKLNDVIDEFSLDNEESAMCRLQKLLTDAFSKIHESLGIESATAAVAAKGHVKGFEFEKDLYAVFAELGNQLGDETELVRGTVGAISRCKVGDYVGTLGETSGAPTCRIVIEVKNPSSQSIRLKDAIEELKTAKENREAQIGIFVFASGSEPDEVGDFRRIGEDFYVTVDKDDLADESPLLYFEAAYKISRTLIVASARKEAACELDTQKIRDQVNALASWSDRIADMATKAKTIQRSGQMIEETVTAFKNDLDDRLKAIIKTLILTMKSK